MAAFHSHGKRLVVAYLVTGDYPKHGDGQGIIVHRLDEQWDKGSDVVHLSENRGSDTTYLVNVEIVRRQ
jgi:hypothetical protein